MHIDSGRIHVLQQILFCLAQGADHMSEHVTRHVLSEAPQLACPGDALARHAAGNYGEHRHTAASTAINASTDAKQPHMVSAILPNSSIPLPGLQAALPALPEDLADLVDEVFSAAAGPVAVQAVRDFLQTQRATSLEDLQFLELSWMQVLLTSLLPVCSSCSTIASCEDSP